MCNKEVHLLVIGISIFNCVYGFFIDVVVFRDDVTWGYGSYRKFVDLL
jgi:hypothetical protein